MVNAERSTRDRYLSFLLLSVFGVAIAVLVAVLLYRFQFGSRLSVTSSEWSNFGGYIGGIFGPLVSFVTLLAVLKTVYMQRDILETQKKEFTELMALQRAAALKQDEQLLHAKSEANRARVQAYQSTILNAIEGFSAEFRLDSNEKLAAAEKARLDGSSILHGVNTAASYRASADEARKQVAAFKILALELSVNEFADVEEVKAMFVPRMQEIMNGVK